MLASFYIQLLAMGMAIVSTAAGRPGPDTAGLIIRYGGALVLLAAPSLAVPVADEMQDITKRAKKGKKTKKAKKAKKAKKTNKIRDTGLYGERDIDSLDEPEAAPLQLDTVSRNVSDDDGEIESRSPQPKKKAKKKKGKKTTAAKKAAAAKKTAAAEKTTAAKKTTTSVATGAQATIPTTTKAATVTTTASRVIAVKSTA